MKIKNILLLSIFCFGLFASFNANAQPFSTNLKENVAKVDGADGKVKSIVECGNDSSTTSRCRIDDLFDLSTKFASYIIAVIFPALFFFGLYMTLYPLIKDPDNPTNRAESRQNGMKLLIGTVFVLGAYLIVKSILVSIGLTDDKVFQKVIKTENGPVSFLGIEKAFAQDSKVPKNSGSFGNPLTEVTVQNVLGGIINVVTFIAVLGIIYMLIRGVMYLMLGQENPGNISKGKTWIMWGLIVAALVFGAQMILSILSNTATGVFNIK
jgi:hypothetical protein